MGTMTSADDAHLARELVEERRRRRCRASSRTRHRQLPGSSARRHESSRRLRDRRGRTSVRLRSRPRGRPWSVHGIGRAASRTRRRTGSCGLGPSRLGTRRRASGTAGPCRRRRRRLRARACAPRLVGPRRAVASRRRVTLGIAVGEVMQVDRLGRLEQRPLACSSRDGSRGRQMIGGPPRSKRWSGCLRCFSWHSRRRCSSHSGWKSSGWKPVMYAGSPVGKVVDEPRADDAEAAVEPGEELADASGRRGPCGNSSASSHSHQT